MNQKSRSYNSALNAVVNVVVQFLILIINFAARKIFIVAFGENYLGINGLYSNILQVLSLAELGVGSAIVYCLYKPVAEKDYSHINALINYYKRLYRIIGIIVACLGILIIPFLKYLINLEADIGNVTLYYLLYLANVVTSYFLVYKTAILTADQRGYVIRICTVAVNAVQFVVLSVVALTFHNYTLYLFLQILFSVLVNVVCSVAASKSYPFINGDSEISAEEKKSIWDNIKMMFSYQIGNVIVNNTDNILISVLVSTVTVGFYSNYSMVVTAVSTFTGLLFTSVQASIGNLAATETEEQQYEIFKKLSMVSFCISSFATLSFVVLFQDFITLMYTEHYLLGLDVVLVCAFNFYLINILQPIYCYRNTVGLFRHTKWVMLYTSIINIVLSLIFGKLWGLFGILLATAVSRIATNFWYEPLKLYKNYFNRGLRSYFVNQLVNILFVGLMLAVAIGASYLMKDLNITVRFALKIALCIIISLVTFIIRYGQSEAFKSIITTCRNVIINRK